LGETKEGIEVYLWVVLGHEEKAGKRPAGVEQISGEGGARRWWSPAIVYGGEGVGELRHGERKLAAALARAEEGWERGLRIEVLGGGGGSG
jgi:hypothetical protein